MTLMRARPQCHAKLWEPIGRMRRQRHRQAASLHGLKSPYFGFGTKRNSSRQRISSTIRTSPRSSSALRANCGPSLIDQLIEYSRGKWRRALQNFGGFLGDGIIDGLAAIDSSIRPIICSERHQGIQMLWCGASLQYSGRLAHERH
jgi:hypothetical protein